MLITGINGESTSMAWPTLGSRTAKNRTEQKLITILCLPSGGRVIAVTRQSGISEVSARAATDYLQAVVL